MRRICSTLSILLIGLVAYFIVAGAISYAIEIEKPLQGGWNSYRLTEFGIQLTPYILIFCSLIVTRVRTCPKWLFFVAMTWLLFCSVVTVIWCVKSALFLQPGAWFTLLVFVSLLGANLRFISLSESSRLA
jgi:hypothetical protein